MNHRYGRPTRGFTLAQINGLINAECFNRCRVGIVISMTSLAALPTDLAYGKPVNRAYLVNAPNAEQSNYSKDYQEEYGEEKSPTSWKLDNSLLGFEPEISVYTGPSHADFGWSIASDASGDRTPNTLSELSYDGLSLTEAGITVQWQYHNWIVETTAIAGHVSSGTVQDSDYDGDNRTAEYSRSYADAGGSSTQQLRAGIAYQWQLAPGFIWHSMIGLSRNAQALQKKNGRQAIATANRTLSEGAFYGLDSRYDALWQGAWIGSAWFIDRDQHRWTLRVEQHWPEYYAEAQWNLRSDFAQPKSFTHHADGHGKVISFSYDYHFSAQLSAAIVINHENWRSENGVDTLYFSNGRQTTTRLNHAEWQKAGVSIGLRFR